MALLEFHVCETPLDIGKWDSRDSNPRLPSSAPVSIQFTKTKLGLKVEMSLMNMNNSFSLVAVVLQNIPLRLFHLSFLKVKVTYLHDWLSLVNSDCLEHQANAHCIAVLHLSKKSCCTNPFLECFCVKQLLLSPPKFLYI